MKALKDTILIVMIACAAFLAAADKPVLSTWTAAPPTIDGEDSDWDILAFVDARNENISYAFANDDRNLYVLFIVKNPEYRSTIEQTGVTIYFNADGEKKTKYGILFKKILINPDAYIALAEKQDPLTDEEKIRIRTKPGYYLYHHQLLGKKNNDVPVPEGTQPAVHKSASRGSRLVYEFQIPLQRTAESPAGVGVEPGKSVMIGIEYGGMTEEMRKARSRQTAPPSIASEQMTERPVVAGMNRNEIIGPTGGKTPKKYTFWSHVRLAREAK